MPKSRLGPQIRRNLPRAVVLLFVALLFACGSSATSTPVASTSSSASPTAAPEKAAQAPAKVGKATAVPGRPTPLPKATEAPAAKAKPSGVLNHGVPETGIFQGHPTEVSSPRIQYMSSSVGEGLVTIGRDLMPNPMIATSWEVSDDFLEWTWKIRDDVEFHKGYGHMTTEDVIYSLKGFYEGAKLARAGILGNYYGFDDKGDSSTEIIDDYTYVVKNSKPWVPATVNEFSRNAAGVSVWMVSKKQSDELGSDKASIDIASTGPWEVVDHVSGSYWRFKAVEDHWRKTPYFEAVSYTHLTLPTILLV